jgi:hypothetical protein
MSTVAAAMILRRGGLVAPCGQHHAVDRVSIEDLDQAQVLQVAIECRSRALERLLDRVDGELEGDAASLPDALAHSLGELEVMPVAGCNVRAGLGDADDRLARLQILEGPAVGQQAFQVERDHVNLVGIVEPVLGAETPRFRVGNLLGHGNRLRK